MEKPDSYTLTQISEWAKSNQVTLPTVQRGFVWKPNQIENLWDSLLRGYPVGCFVLSNGNGSKGNKAPIDLLDGQQRATAICLGFGNLAFKQTVDQIKVFIDLESPKKNDNRKYLFRVITKSHPWGYQAVDNSKPLEAGTIRKAMNLYGVQDHLDEPLEKFFPYDAVFPLPFDLFLKYALVKDGEKALMKCLKEWGHWKSIYKTWKNKIEKETGGKKLPQINTSEAINNKIISIYNDVVLMLHGDDERKIRRIPALYLNLNEILPVGMSSLSEKVSTNANSVSDEATDETDDDEIETLFIRLNAGGIPLRGEELNYSILKSNINSKLQKAIEDACIGLFAPARFITIAYRLFQCSGNTGARDPISMKIKPKQFQKTMAEKKDSFAAFLKNLIENNNFDGNTLLQYTKNILVYDEKLNPQGLPYLVVNRLSSSAPELMFMLLYRLIMGDRFFPKKNPDLHRRMLGIITLFAWLGKGDKLRDHSKLLDNVWPATALDDSQFWSSATVQRAMLNEVLPLLPTHDKLEKLNGSKARKNSDIWSCFEKSCDSSSLIFKKLFNNRDLILYAQRQALFEWFENKIYHLDDTNVPFDWDHIFPNNYVKGKRNIPKNLKESYNTNGNFRAWPYPLNRADQDALPSAKLNPNSENTQDYDDMLASWQRYFQANPRIHVDIMNLCEQVLEWSKCKNEWINPQITNVKKQSNIVYNLIIKRNVELCQEWYNEMLIDSLIPANEDAITFAAFLNKTKWKNIPEKFNERFDDIDEYNYQVSSSFEIEKSKYYLFLCYPGLKKEDLMENIKEGAIFFGIIDEDKKTLDTLRLPTGEENKYQVFSDDGVIQNSFTLISYQEQHYYLLFAQIYCWLLYLPNKKLNVMAKHFLDCLEDTCRKRVLEKKCTKMGIEI